jgi:hypothetical protein
VPTYLLLNEIRILLGKGSDTFQTAEKFEAGSGHFCVVGDFNGDGKPDLAVSDGLSNQLSIRLNKPKTGRDEEVDSTCGSRGDPGPHVRGSCRGNDSAPAGQGQRAETASEYRWEEKMRTRRSVWLFSSVIAVKESSGAEQNSFAHDRLTSLQKI